MRSFGSTNVCEYACAHMHFLAPGFHPSESKFAVERAGIRSAVSLLVLARYKYCTVRGVAKI